MQKKNSQQSIEISKIQEHALERDEDDNNDNLGEINDGAEVEPDAKEAEFSDSGAEDEEFKKREPEPPTPSAD